MMHISEMESRLMNNVKPPGKVKGLLDKVESGYTLKNVADARDMIAELVGCVKS